MEAYTILGFRGLSSSVYNRELRSSHAYITCVEGWREHRMFRLDIKSKCLSRNTNVLKHMQSPFEL